VTEGYTEIKRVWADGDEVTLAYKTSLKVHRLNGKCAVTKGAIVYARDERYGDGFGENVKIADEPTYAHTRTTGVDVNEEIEIVTEDGKRIRLCDYASAGADWRKGKNKVSVWLA
jgi:DUF1680 family protein